MVCHLFGAKQLLAHSTPKDPLILLETFGLRNYIPNQAMAIGIA